MRLVPLARIVTFLALVLVALSIAACGVVRFTASEMPLTPGAILISVPTRLSPNVPFLHEKIHLPLVRIVTHFVLGAPDATDHPARLDLEGRLGGGQSLHLGEELAQEQFEMKDLILGPIFADLAQGEFGVGPHLKFGTIEESNGRGGILGSGQGLSFLNFGVLVKDVGLLALDQGDLTGDGGQNSGNGR